jgi:hypothetical protein
MPTPAHLPASMSVFNPNGTDIELLGGVAIASIPLNVSGLGAAAAGTTTSLNLTSSATHTRKILTFKEWLEAWMAYCEIVCCNPAVAATCRAWMMRHIQLMFTASEEFGFGNAYACEVNLRKACPDFVPIAWDQPFLLSRMITDHSVSRLENVERALAVSRTTAPQQQAQRAQAISAATAYSRPAETEAARKVRVAHEICENFNTSQCRYGRSCFRMHVCSSCRGSHPEFECPESRSHRPTDGQPPVPTTRNFNGQNAGRGTGPAPIRSTRGGRRGGGKADGQRAPRY